MGHELRWHPNYPLTRRQQVRFQAAGQMPAVLHRPAALGSEPVGPPHQLQVRFRGGGQRSLRVELSPGVVDRHHRVGALVRVDAQDDHPPVPSFS